MTADTLAMSLRWRKRVLLLVAMVTAYTVAWMVFVTMRPYEGLSLNHYHASPLKLTQSSHLKPAVIVMAQKRAVNDARTTPKPHSPTPRTDAKTDLAKAIGTTKESSQSKPGDGKTVPDTKPDKVEKSSDDKQKGNDGKNHEGEVVPAHGGDSPKDKKKAGDVKKANKDSGIEKNNGEVKQVEQSKDAKTVETKQDEPNTDTKGANEKQKETKNKDNPKGTDKDKETNTKDVQKVENTDEKTGKQVDKAKEDAPPPMDEMKDTQSAAKNGKDKQYDNIHLVKADDDAAAYRLEMENYPQIQIEKENPSKDPALADDSAPQDGKESQIVDEPSGQEKTVNDKADDTEKNLENPDNPKKEAAEMAAKPVPAPDRAGEDKNQPSKDEKPKEEKQVEKEKKPEKADDKGDSAPKKTPDDSARKEANVEARPGSAPEKNAQKNENQGSKNQHEKVGEQPKKDEPVETKKESEKDKNAEEKQDGSRKEAPKDGKHEQDNNKDQKQKVEENSQDARPEKKQNEPAKVDTKGGSAQEKKSDDTKKETAKEEAKPIPAPVDDKIQGKKQPAKDEKKSKDDKTGETNQKVEKKADKGDTAPEKGPDDANKEAAKVEEEPKEEKQAQAEKKAGVASNADAAQVVNKPLDDMKFAASKKEPAKLEKKPKTDEKTPEDKKADEQAGDKPEGKPKETKKDESKASQGHETNDKKSKEPGKNPAKPGDSKRGETKPDSKKDQPIPVELKSKEAPKKEAPPKPVVKPVVRPVRRRARRVTMPYNLSRIRTRHQALELLRTDLENFKKRIPEKVPKIIHQIYRDPFIPDAYANFIRSWVKHNPDYKYYFWDDKSGPKFIRKYYPDFAPLYEAYCHDLMRSDALRYFILHKYGGFYADADYECFKPIDRLLQSSQCHLVQENWAQAKLLYNSDLLVQNSFMASTPGHPFMHFVINNLPPAAPVRNCQLWTVLSATGPLLLDRCRQIYERTCKSDSCRINVLPSKIMMPEYDMDHGKPKYYRGKCNSIAMRKLNKGGKEACAYFKQYLQHPPKIGPEVYASHKFLHIGNEAHSYKAKSYQPIQKLVPRVQFPKV